MFSAAAVAILFAACSNDDVVNDNPITTETSYVNVKVVMGGNSNGTRAGYAAADDEFDPGTQQEAQVHNLSVYLYDHDGRLVGMGTKTDFGNPQAKNENVSDTYDAVMEVSLLPGSAQPEYLMAFVNSNDVPRDVLNDLYTQTVRSVGNLEDGLTMSTSRYFDGQDTWFKGTEMTPSDLYDTYAEAANPNNEALEIYVERLAAKMTVNKKQNDIVTTADQRLYDLNGNEYQITFNVKKWAATGTAPEMYYVKNAFNNSLTSLKDWANDASKNRSYWANGVYHNVNYSDMTSKLYYVSANQILYKESDKGLSLGGDALYVPEHTYGENALKTPYDASKPELPRYYNHMMTATSAIVVGQYSITPTGAGDATHFSNGNGGFDFYISLRGFDGVNETLTIYNETDLIKTLLDRNLKDFAIDEQGTALTADKYSEYVKLKKTTDKQYTLESTGKTLYLDGQPVDDFSEVFIATINAAHYKNGWAYFFIPVVHNQNLTADTDEGAVGVVRNHSYKILINSIKGLGAPLDETKVGDDPENTPPTETDPDDPDPDPEDPGDTPIIPDPDMLRNAYIDATLNVLSWHNAKDQIVDLK